MAVITTERPDVRRRMLIQRQIDARMNTLLERITKLVDATNIASSRMEKHQIGNVLSAALDTQSGEVLKNFIRYQIGRDFAGNSWRHKKFGELLVGELDRLRDIARDIATVVNITLGSSDEPTEADVDEIWIELARQYMGQLNRYFYYKKEQAR